MHTTYTLNRRGVSLAYALLLMGVLFGFASFAVDWGRVQLAKTQLRAGADAASRHGAMLLATSPTAAINAAAAAAGDNKVDGSTLVLDKNADIELGFWDVTTRKFTRYTGANLKYANAVRVVARRTAARGNAIPTVFAQLLGHKSADISAESIAMLKPPTVIEHDVPATASPFLAGMPTGTVSSLNNPHNSPDYAPTQSPVQVNLAFKDGEALTFDNIAGLANNDNNWTADHNPDGNLSWFTWNEDKSGPKGPEHGKSNLYAPINSLVGVFLTDAVPTNANAPESLNFAMASQRNFEELKPKIGQVFFIGDGTRDNGDTQRFVVPKGATRFYVANWDGYEWNNNIGSRTTRITRLGSVVTVK